MTRRFTRIPAAVLGLAFLCVGALAGQDAQQEKAMMEAWQKAATPGEGHKKLDALVGTFDAKVRSWVDQSRPPEDSVGTSTNSWVLGGRYVEQEFDGEFMGEPYRGIGYTGYDNVQKKFVSVWMDTAGTGMMFLTSAWPTRPARRSRAARASGTPSTEKPLPVESKITVTDNDHHSFELLAKAPNGKMIKLMEIQYTRKK